MDKLKVGRRKTAIARASISAGTGEITVNGRSYKVHFPLVYLQNKVEAPFIISGSEGKYDASVTVNGGGLKGQAEAISLALSRALITDNAEKRPALKKAKLLRRDSRKVERKKTGLRKARKREQYSKR